MTTVDFPDEPAGLPAALAAVSALPLLELPDGPQAPYFDGTQLCAQVDPELFFPDSGGSVQAAKRLCGGCEFLNPCRRYAMTAWVAGYPVGGVWGGTSANDRQHFRRAAAAAGSGRLDIDAVPDEVLVDEDLAS